MGPILIYTIAELKCFVSFFVVVCKIAKEVDPSIHAVKQKQYSFTLITQDLENSAGVMNISYKVDLLILCHLKK